MRAHHTVYIRLIINVRDITSRVRDWLNGAIDVRLFDTSKPPGEKILALVNKIAKWDLKSYSMK
jgi:hypothetical protein